MPSLDDLILFQTVAKAGGFREGARRLDMSASTLSDAILRLEAQLQIRLLHRTTRSVTPTDAGRQLLLSLDPALAEISSALDDVANMGAKPRGPLKLNVPGAVMVDILPPLIERFLSAYPDVRVEIMVEDRFVDFVARGCDAGIRYGEALAQDVIAVPIGPARQQAGAAASPVYLAARGVPDVPEDLLDHACISGRFSSGKLVPWEFEKDGRTIEVEPEPRLVVGTGAAQAAIGAAVSGVGIVYTFANWLQPHIAAGRLVPVLPDWWASFEGPYLYYSSRRHVPAALRAFIDMARTGRP